MKAINLFIPIFLFASFLAAQKEVRKTIINPNNQYLKINTRNCYKVELFTGVSKELEVKAFIEGQYQKDVVVNIEEDGLNMHLSVDYLPSFAIPNDKLGAHRLVAAIALQIWVPEYTNTSVYGTSSTFFASGKYRNLKVTLSDGDCTLENVSEQVEIKTQNGDIHVYAKEGIINAKSIYGIVKVAKIPSGDSNYKLASVEGNIYVSKTE